MVSAVILTLTALYTRKVYTKEHSSLYNLLITFCSNIQTFFRSPPKPHAF